ncbi:Resolvase [Lactococcus raffinolactis 4877]|nr:Resolvase [Lactococcus raffinolactis 4877]
MAKIGYARVSSKEQNLERQLQALESVSKVFSDKVSGAYYRTTAITGNA